MAARGLRAIAVARIILPRPIPDDYTAAPADPSSPSVVDHRGAEWRLLGLVPLYDPPREDSARTIQRLLDIGVAVKMITGDQVEIGRDTATRLGMGNNIVNCDQLNVEPSIAAKIAATHRLPPDLEDLASLVERSDGFGQVFPDHKHLVVSLLQARGHIVGMTGNHPRRTVCIVCMSVLPLTGFNNSPVSNCCLLVLLLCGMKAMA